MSEDFVDKKLRKFHEIDEMKNQKTLKIEVSSKEMEKLVKEKQELKERIKELEENANLSPENRKFLAKEAFKTAIREANEEDLLEKAEKEDLDVKIDPIGKGSSGVIGLEHNLSNNEAKSWDSEESMVFELAQLKSIGTPIQKKEAKAVLDALYKKLRDSIRNGNLPRNIYEDKPEEHGNRSLFRRVMDAKDAETRARLQKERKK